MRISIWSHDSIPFVDQRLCGKSVLYCEQEVIAGRALQLDADDIRKGIQLLPPEELVKRSKIEHRGSPESRGCLTAGESQLNADCRTKATDIAHLSFEYEWRLDRHIAQGNKGLPIACSRIAAKVKTILSDPVYGRPQAQSDSGGGIPTRIPVACGVPDLSMCVE